MQTNLENPRTNQSSGPAPGRFISAETRSYLIKPEPVARTPVQSDPDILAGHPALGEFSYELRGVPLQRQAFTSALYQFQRVFDEIADVEEAGRARFEETVRRTGGEALLEARLNWRIRLENNRYLLD